MFYSATLMYLDILRDVLRYFGVKWNIFENLQIEMKNIFQLRSIFIDAYLTSHDFRLKLLNWSYFTVFSLFIWKNFFATNCELAIFKYR